MAKKVAAKNNLKLDVVLIAFNLYYERIKDEIEKLDPREVDLSDLDNDVSMTSFNILKIGKMYTTPRIIKSINERKDKYEGIGHEKGDYNG